MVAASTRAPSWLRLEDGVDGVVVDRGGWALGMQLLPGDRLVIDTTSQDGLLLLRPWGLGRPMLGRWSDGRLLAEPGAVPALCKRWAVVGGLAAVDRDLARPSLGAVTGWVAVRGGESGDGGGVVGTLGAPAVYLCARPGDVDVLCRQLALIARRAASPLAVALASDRARALDLLRCAPVSSLRVAATCLRVAPPDLEVVRETWPLTDAGADGLLRLRTRMAAQSRRGRIAAGAGHAQGRAPRRGFAAPPPQLPLPGLSHPQ